jgi:hypothetical protein
MKFFAAALLMSSLFLLPSCIEHEVIPPPKPVVELEATFQATIDGTNYSLFENVNGTFAESTKAKEILPTPQPSTATYFATMKSLQQLDLIQLGMGKLLFNAEISADPSVEQFETYFLANINPNFSQGSVAGVEIVFRDNAGNVWYSNPSSPDPQNFIFSSLALESDEEGDYMKFTATFSCRLFDNIANPTASIDMQNAVYKCYFKR